jgi:DUF2934 family protein
LPREARAIEEVTMATKASKPDTKTETKTDKSSTSTVKAKAEKSTKTSAPKLARARKSSSTAELPALSYDVIAERAYVRFCERGHEHGHDLEDWIAAEHELRQG